MKCVNNTPLGVCSSNSFDLELTNPTDEFASEQVSPLLYAAPLRRRAGEVLELAGTDNRLNLILGLIVVLSLGLAVPLILDCLLLMAELLSLLSGGAEVMWIGILYGVLLIGTTLFLTVPLAASVYRMAVLMTVSHAKATQGTVPEKIGVGECLYAFTSADAYKRSLLVGGRALGRTLLCIAPAGGILGVAAWGLPKLAGLVPSIVYVLAWVLCIALAVVSVWLLLCYVSRGAGLGYAVMAQPEKPVGEILAQFSAIPRNGSLPTWMALGHLWRIALSALAVCVPLLIHTLPHVLLSCASYGRFLLDTDIRSVQADVPEASLEDPITAEVLHHE